ncbi:MAG: hypothetical protein HYR63_29390 [Proteobacteria bacterium]|nr:hypothetical protein [Pseudomonadota bacterium]
MTKSLLGAAALALVFELATSALAMDGTASRDRDAAYQKPAVGATKAQSASTVPSVALSTIPSTGISADPFLRTERRGGRD